MRPLGRQIMFAFDPSSMLNIEEIDLTCATTIAGNEDNYFTSLIYNEVTGKLYATLYTDLDATGQFYDAENTYVEVIDVASRLWEKEIVHANAEYALFRGNTNSVIDEQGNTYLVAQGQYGLDGGFDPTAPAGS